jgi:hypothetical protein
MTTPQMIACQRRKCKWLFPPEGPPEDAHFVCMAFPAGIPRVIRDGENLHTRPYPGDDGYRYERDAGRG